MQKYVSLLVLLMVGIRDRKMIHLFSFLLPLPRSVNSAVTQIKLRSGKFQPAQVQFYSMLSQMPNGGKTSPPLFRAAMTSSTFLPSQYHCNDRIPEVCLCSLGLILPSNLNNEIHDRYF